MVDALLLEWEGVLADTGDARRETLLRALADEGVLFDSSTYDTACASLDVAAASRTALARAGVSDGVLADLVATRASRAFVERVAHGLVLAPGAAAFVRAAAAGARIAIVTRAMRAETDAVLRMAELEPMISSVVCADDAPGLPHVPVLFDEALAHLGRRRAVRRNRTVAMVDAAPAIRAARSAELRIIAVGAPAHVAIEADAAVEGVDGLTLPQVAALAGLAPMERRA